MSFEALKDFEFYNKIPDEIIKKYQGIIPIQLMEIWKEYGFGSFWNGYLKVINPDDYKSLLDEMGFPSTIVPVFTTAFGDIIAWEGKNPDNENEIVGLIKLRYGRVDMLDMSFDEFLSFLKNENSTILKTKFDSFQYEEAIEKYGKLDYNECFGYVPLLAFGGPEDVANLQKVGIRVHIDIMAQS